MVVKEGKKRSLVVLVVVVIKELVKWLWEYVSFFLLSRCLIFVLYGDQSRNEEKKGMGEDRECTRCSGEETSTKNHNNKRTRLLALLLLFLLLETILSIHLNRWTRCSTCTRG